MTQQEIWTKEYENEQNLPSSRTDRPSRAVIEFFESEYAIDIKTALDAGCGKGRNSIYLAQKSIQVIGIDFIKTAIDIATQTVKSLELSNKAVFICQSMADPLSEQDSSVDLIIDMMSLHTLKNADRQSYIKETNRILKQGKYFIFYTIASDSPAAQELFRGSPGDELNSYIIPQNGAFEKAFSKEDMQNLFPNFEFIKFERRVECTPAFGDVYERVYYSGILRKIY